MRRLIFSSVFMLFAIAMYGQNFKLGVQLSPGISNTRLETESTTPYISDEGSALKLRFGPILDYAITDTYFFSTGILFAPKEFSVSYYNDGGSTIQEETYKLNYLQIPIALKLYTNEIMLDTKVYVKMGITTEIKIADKKEDIYPNPLVSKFSFFDSSLLVGAGVEYNIGTNTAIFAGLSYNRGLINTLSKYRENDVNDSSLKVHNDLFNLDLGVKF